MKVKICGITTAETAAAASSAGADILGFVFAKSKREISPEKAADIVKKLPKHIAAAGVFVNESFENIVRIAELVGLDYIQLHGDETPDFCKSMPLPVIKAFSIQEERDLEGIADYECEFVLLDSPGVKYRGGSGIPFDWSLLADQAIPREKIILAGGLNENNVVEAIEKVQPAVVDVSSGVETDGEKDHKKIAAFIKQAKQRNEPKESAENGRIHIT